MPLAIKYSKNTGILKIFVYFMLYIYTFLESKFPEHFGCNIYEQFIRAIELAAGDFIVMLQFRPTLNPTGPNVHGIHLNICNIYILLVISSYFFAKESHECVTWSDPKSLCQT